MVHVVAEKKRWIRLDDVMGEKSNGVVNVASPSVTMKLRISELPSDPLLGYIHRTPIQFCTLALVHLSGV